MSQVVGSVFQNPKTQFFHTNSSAEMAFGLENRGDDPETIRKRVAETVRELDIEKLADRNVFAMSGGEKQRVAVARALINSPSVILADEPSGSLDSQNKEELHKLLFELRDKFGLTLVIVTHDEGLASLCDRTIHMKDGIVVDL